MAISVTQKTLLDGNGSPYLLNLLTDGTEFTEIGSIFDPSSGKYAEVDGSNRLLVLADLNGPQVVTGAGTFDTQDVADVNSEVLLLPQVARTVSVGIQPDMNEYCKGVYVCLNVPTQTTTGSITPNFVIINGTVNVNSPTLLSAPPTITAAGTTWFYIGPVAPPTTLVPTSNQVIMTLPRNWGMQVTANNSNSIIYSATLLYHK